MAYIDCSRSSVLKFQFPPPSFVPGHRTGSTRSSWGLAWTHLYYWTEQQIAATFNAYWNSIVTTQDKEELIANRYRIDGQIQSLTHYGVCTDEMHTRQIFDAGISWIHRISISNDNNQSPPSDPHSTIRLYQNIVFGEPDYLLQNPNSFLVKGICEAKSPWNIGPSEIDDVISGHADQTSAGRLAIEQVYGYMCWNAVSLGILMTTTGFVFLWRRDGGVLYMSRLYGSHSDLEPYQYVMPHSMASESGFTISHMLYWFTALTEQAQLLPETSLQGSIQLLNAQRPANPYTGTTQIAAPIDPNYSSPQQGPPIAPLSSFQHGLNSADDVFLNFKPWTPGTHLGGRAWHAVLLPEKLPVVLKCWDSHKHNPDALKNEVDIYLKLQKLWGTCVPKFIASGRVGFCHAMVLDYLNAKPVSIENLSANVEDKIRKAYGELHQLGVLHGDVRPSNILVSSSESVYIIDFENASMASERVREGEMLEVQRILLKVRRNGPKNGMEWCVGETYIGHYPS